MAIIAYITDKSKVFWQEWSDETEMPGEPAIIITVHENEIEITQEGRYVLISKHELKAFVKLLKGIK